MKTLLGVPLLAALVLAACGLPHGDEVGTTQTTGAELTLADPVTLLPNSVRDASTTRPSIASPPGVSVGLDDRASVDTRPAYDRPPLHEPMGSTYSDVGMPYPLPEIPASFTPPLRSEPTATAPPSPPFFESSFGPEPAVTPTSAFPETTFGPNGPTSSEFPETTFRGDVGR